MVVLDTCAIIKLVSDDSISKKTIAKIKKGAVIISISFAEIACKVNIGKLDLGKKSIVELYELFRETENIEIIDVSVEMWLNAIQLDWPTTKSKQHKDPADRVILAYAKNNFLPIVTSDKLMHAQYKDCLW